MSNELLAGQIADAILNANVCGPANRIDLRQGVTVEQERSMGGLNRDGLVAVILRTLKEQP